MSDLPPKKSINDDDDHHHHDSGSDDLVGAFPANDQSSSMDVSDRANARAKRRSRLEQKKCSSLSSDQTPEEEGEEEESSNNDAADRPGGDELRLSYSRPSEIPESGGDGDGVRVLAQQSEKKKNINNDKDSKRDEKLRLSSSSPLSPDADARSRRRSRLDQRKSNFDAKVPLTSDSSKRDEKLRLSSGAVGVGVVAPTEATNGKDSQQQKEQILRLSYSRQSHIPESGELDNNVVANNIEDQVPDNSYDAEAAANNPPSAPLPVVSEQQEVGRTIDRSNDEEQSSPTADNGRIVSAVLINEEAIRAEHEREARERILQNTAMATVVEKDDETSCVSRPSRLICFCLIVVIAIVVVAVTLASQSNGKEGPTSQIDQPSSAPTIVKEKFLGQALQQNLGQYMDEVDTTGTNFAKAMDWILYDDPAGLDIRRMSEVQLVERFVIALVYFSTNGTNWTNQLDFLSDTSVCDWADRTIETDSIIAGYGLSCNGEGRIQSINLGANVLLGTIPSEVSFLQDLKGLFLAENKIIGNIPSELGKLSNLENFALKQNEVSGTVPLQLTLNPNLKTIDLSHNQFGGRIPDFRLRTAVASIDLSHNHFNGTIPSSITFLGGLKNLNLERNELTGRITSRLGLLGNLESLSLSHNLIGGPIPTELGDLENVQALMINNNRLTSTIPTQIGNLNSIVHLDLAKNTLSGTIPTEISNLAVYGRVRSIQLSENMLSSAIPSELGMLTTLTSLGLSQNLLTGPLPRSFEMFSVDTRIRLDGNSLVDNFDKFVCEWDLLVTSADCEEVECGCCPICCSDDEWMGECEVNGDLTCFQETKQIIGRSPESWGTECRCYTSSAGEGLGYRCSDVTCEACNSDGTVCVRNVEFAASILFEGSYDVTMEYVRGRNETIQYSRNFPGDPEFCSVAIDGVQCDSCDFLTCADGSEVHKVVCDFLDAGRYDGCRDTSFSGSALEVFYIFDYGTSQTCPPRLQPYVG